MHQSFITTILVFLLELRFALTAPIAVSNEQQQVLLEEHEQAHPKVQDTKATVGIAFQSTSLSSNDYAEIPIGKRISFRKSLHTFSRLCLPLHVMINNHPCLLHHGRSKHEQLISYMHPFH